MINKHNTPFVRRYFVDEAGDCVLYNRKGQVIIGQAGCSRFFILGVADIADPELLGSDLENLRSRLLADPYFEGVPSMKIDGNKTAIAFHAKDDLPKVRREVFSLLLDHDIHFSAIVRDKIRVVEYVKQRNKLDHFYRYNTNELYDYMVRRLFRDRLHKDDAYEIFFAKRGKSDRTIALLQALKAAKRKFQEKMNIENNAPITVKPTSPPECTGLQATDYLLWALQRLYERQEERFIKLVWSKNKSCSRP
jgi:hypothetical protein